MSAVANRRSVMTCFSSPVDPQCHRSRIVLAEKDITVEIFDVDMDNLPEDLLDLNPYATVPTMVDRDLVLYDARVLIEYLDERFPHPPLMPVDPVSRAKARLGLFRIESDWYSLLPDIEHGTEKKKEQARKALKEVPDDGTLEILATDPGSVADFEAFCRQTGNELLESTEEGGKFCFLMKKT